MDYSVSVQEKVQDMRETIKGILRSLPGYKGYEEQENRREADAAVRRYLVQEYQRERDTLSQLAQKAVDMGKIEYLVRIEEIIQMLNRFIARVDSAPRGYASWFSAAQMTTADLDQIYEFDTRMVDTIPLIQQQVLRAANTLKPSDNESTETFDDMLDALKAFVHGLNTQFDARQQFVALGKQPN